VVHVDVQPSERSQVHEQSQRAQPRALGGQSTIAMQCNILAVSAFGDARSTGGGPVWFEVPGCWCALAHIVP
jgi:hypothetical protein